MPPLRLLVALCALALCCAHRLEGRSAVIFEALTRADAASHRSLSGRYELLATSPMAFYRGSLSLFRRDWDDPATGLSRSRFTVAASTLLGAGDPHVENFGTLLGRDGRPTLELDDLDHAARVPYLWDLRRLAVSLCIAGRTAHPEHRRARRGASNAAYEIAFSTAMGYAEALRSGDPRSPTFDGGRNPVLDDLFRRALRHAGLHSELDELSTLDGATRRLRRGSVGRDDSTHALADLPPAARASLPELLTRYRTTLLLPPDPGFFTVLDAARQLGGGVDSFGRLRVLVLVRGPSDAPSDDVILEVKELSDASAVGRVLEARGALWSRPDADPLWGAGEWLGIPVQVRARSEAAKGVRVLRMVGPLGTPDALRGLARALGAELGRIHRRSLPSAPQLAAIGRDVDAFADEQAAVSSQYAAQVFDDFRRFRRLLAHWPAAVGTLGR